MSTGIPDQPLAPAAAERQRIARFAAVGFLGYAINVVLFALFVGGLGWDHRIGAAIATGLALCCNFVLNRAWAFEATDGHAGVHAAKFAVVSAVAIAVNVLAVIAFVDGLGFEKVAGEAVAVFIQAPVSYVGNRYWTFAD